MNNLGYKVKLKPSRSDKNSGQWAIFGKSITRVIERQTTQTLAVRRAVQLSYEKCQVLVYNEKGIPEFWIDERGKEHSIQFSDISEHDENNETS
jgi:hypothetical protein